MDNLNLKILKIDGKEELVVLTLADYRTLREALEDAEDVLAMRAARKHDAGKPELTSSQLKTRLKQRKKAPVKKKVTRRRAG